MEGGREVGLRLVDVAFTNTALADDTTFLLDTSITGKSMPIFISYNHEDKHVAETLAANLVHEKHHVWIDTWELNAGDSLIERIQDALGDADAILVLLSQNSIRSEWCKKELRSGLIRELEEKSVLVIPIVLDDCEIPLFLKEKLWIDLRKDKDAQLDLLLRSLERVSNPSQGRAETLEYHVDWSMNGVTIGELPGVEWTFVDHGEKLPYVALTSVMFVPEGNSSAFMKSLRNNDDRYKYSAECMKKSLESVDDFRVLLDSAEPKVLGRSISDPIGGGEVTVQVVVRRLGMDNGMDTLVDVGRNLDMAIKHTLGVLRPND